MAEIEKFRGAIIGASCGDALGYPLQNLSVARIKHRFGPFGLRTLVGDPKNGKKAPVSDNTQTLLATIDGILWADAKKLDIIEGIYRSYMRWYYSQTGEEPRRGQKTWMRRQSHEREFCLVREKFMHARRNPEEGLLGAFSIGFWRYLLCTHSITIYSPFFFTHRKSDVNSPSGRLSS